MRKVLALVGILICLLVLPLMINDRSHPLKDFEGIGLDDIPFEEISFYNAVDGIQLGGMLFLPDTTYQEPPLAIIIHGSGYSNRQNRWYLELVKELRDRGIAVLLPDKRGSDRSEGNWIGLSPEDLASDTESAIKYAKRDTMHHYGHIGLIGVSQGGWIAPIVASEYPNLAFVVDISGTLATGRYQLAFEEKNNIAQYTYPFLAEHISKLSLASLEKKESIIPFLNFDPIQYWQKVNIPTFIAFGENDTNCPVEQSLKRIKDNQLYNLEVKVYPDGRHAILDETKTKISPSFISDLVQFIKK
jgi:dipeptidyl aminopeptidase/acylaminoacyl peptidase